MRWPLDPRRATTRDEALLAKTVLATPLRVDQRTGDLAPGLCTSWRRAGAVWTFHCWEAAKVARAIPFGRASAAGDSVRVRLPAPWLRFPYLLTSAQAAVPGTRGPFEVVRARDGEIVAERGALRIVFRQVEPHRAALLFRRGELDEAPVPLGDIRAAQLDARVGQPAQPMPAQDAEPFPPCRVGQQVGTLRETPQRVSSIPAEMLTNRDDIR